MRALIVLALLGCACAAPFLQDTPEVVAERARFTQLWNAQAAAAAAAPDDHASAAPRTVVSHNQPTHHHHHHNQPAATFSTKWTGPVAATIPAGLPGAGAQVQDTADVSAARNAFLAAYRAQVAATTGQNIVAPVQHSAPTHFNAIPAAPQKWTGPVAATVPAGVNGVLTQVADTPEVAAARNAFLASYNAALGHPQPASPAQHTFHSAPAHQAQPIQPRWTGPVAATIPAGLPGSASQVAQTADVAAATAAFTQAYNAAVAATTGRRF